MTINKALKYQGFVVQAQILHLCVKGLKTGEKSRILRPDIAKI